jgi:hypothetical protein
VEFKLVVVRPFAGHTVGNVIGDPKAVADVLQSEHSGHVVRISANAMTAPAAQGKEG